MFMLQYATRFPLATTYHPYFKMTVYLKNDRVPQKWPRTSN